MRRAINCHCSPLLEFFNAEGSFCGFLNARRQYTQNQLAYLEQTNQEITYSANMMLGMIDLVARADDYQDWCSDPDFGPVLQAPEINIEEGF